MPDPLTAIAVGSAALGGVKRLFGGRRRRPDISQAVAELRAYKPRGELYGEDYRSAELTRGRLGEQARARGELAGYEVSRRQRARGLAGSPSEERAQARVGQQTALSLQHAGESAEEQLYNVRMGREAFGNQRELGIFGARVGESAREGARLDAQEGAFWNSMNEFVPTILSYLPAGGGGGGGYDTSMSYRTTGPAGYVPS